MSLRVWWAAYLGTLHLVLAGLAGLLLWTHPWGLVVAEIGLILSALVAFRLCRRLLEPLRLAQAGASLIEEQDFSCTFLEVGQPEVDRLIRVFNRMIGQLREERLRLQEQGIFMDQILACSPSGVVTLDFDERIALANPAAARLLGRPAEELVGRRLSEIASSLATALAGLGTGQSQVVPLQGPRQVRCRRAQLVDRGFPRAFFLLEELTEELRQAEKAAYERIIRLLSHEVNNSVGAVNSLLHSCLHYQDQVRPEDRTDFGQALRVAISRAEHLSTFMKGYAQVVRLPAPRRLPVDLRSLLADTQRLLQPESERRRIGWTWEVAEPLPLVQADRDQLEQVFINVVRNALEAIGEDGRITCRLGCDQGRVWVVVEDSGPGIPAEVRSHLFTPYFSTKDRGQGLGLTLVQEVLSRHGCQYALDSQPGQPTRFTVHFPPAGDAPGPALATGRRTPSTPGRAP
ncbi:MAG: ATP-binding protein [Candidatus Latescibacterota bacterium]